MKGLGLHPTDAIIHCLSCSHSEMEVLRWICFQREVLPVSLVLCHEISVTHIGSASSAQTLQRSWQSRVRVD